MSKKNQAYLILAWYRKLYSRYTTCENCIRLLPKAIFLISLLALSLRIIYLVQTKDNPLFYPVDNGLDSSLYHERAKLIVQGMGLAPDFIYGMPGYPYFLALIYKFLGENVFWVRLIQMLFGVLSCLLIYFIARDVFSQRAAILAMLLFATYGMFVFYEGMLLDVSLGILLGGGIILILFSVQRKSDFKKWCLLGFLVGFYSLLRASILIFIPFALLWFSFTNKESLKRKFFSQLIFGLTCILVILPITIRNYLIAGEFIPLTAHSGINFYIGNNPYADGTFKPAPSMHTSVQGLIADSISQAQKQAAKPLTPSQVSQFWFAQSKQFIQDQPTQYVKLLARKFILLFNAYEIFDVGDYSFFRQHFPTILNLPLPNLRIILPLALLGILVSFKNRRAHLLYLFMASVVISILAYFVHTRYRMPLVPVLIIFAAASIDWWLIKWQAKDFQAVCLSLGLLFLLALATNLKLVTQNYVSEYNNLGVAYKARGQYELAIHAYTQALKIEPNLAQTHSNLGNLYNGTGEYTKAVEEFRRTIEIDPNLAEAYSNLGIVYTKLGREDLAIEEYQKAIELRPNLVMAHYNLGVIYHQKGKLDLAREEFQQAIKFAPDYADAYNNLGAVYFQLNLYQEAKRQWRKALEINPQLWPAEENLKRLERLGY